MNLQRQPANGRSSKGFLWLTSDDLVNAGMTIGHIIDAVTEAYRLTAQQRLAQHSRQQVYDPEGSTFINVMPAVSGSLGLASAHVYIGGHRGRSGIQKLTALHSTEDGGLRALIESDWLSWTRTGASGAVASRYLANEDASVLGIIGAGKQARAQLAAHLHDRDFERCYVYSSHRSSREQFAAETTSDGVPVVALDDPDEVVRRSDIVCTATTSVSPVFSGGAVQAGTHINAIGAHYPNRREVDDQTVALSRVVVDDAARSAEEDGELLLATSLNAARVGPISTLSAVVTGTKVRTSPEDVTLFLSGGLSSEYLAAAAAALRFAEEHGIGRRLTITG